MGEVLSYFKVILVGEVLMLFGDSKGFNAIWR